MKSSQSSSKPATLTNPAPSCAFPGCKIFPTNTCSRCIVTRYCSKDHQTAHWKQHKKLCVAPQKKISAPVPLVPLKDKCVICLSNVPNAKIHPCGHSIICSDCAREFMTRSEPCPICRKPISGFDVGVYATASNNGLWPTSMKFFIEFTSGEGFNGFFHKQFNGNAETYFKWLVTFDILEIEGGKSLEQQVLTITRSEDLVKLRALAELCGLEYINDQSLSAVAWRRILEVLELSMPEEKKGRGKKKKQQLKKKDPRKLEILDACAEIGSATSYLGEFEDTRRYLKRAKEGYEKQIGHDSEKALDMTFKLISVSCTTETDQLDKTSDIVERMVASLGEENVVTLEALNSLGDMQRKRGDLQEARRAHERCLEGREKVLGEEHRSTLGSLNNLGVSYQKLEKYEKALEYYERALKGYEKTLGKAHLNTIDLLLNISICLGQGPGDYVRAEVLLKRALEGYEKLRGKEHNSTKYCAKVYGLCLNRNRKSDLADKLEKKYLGLD